MFRIVGESPDKELLSALSLSDSARAKKAENDETVKNIVMGRDKRKLVVCGPCSADNPVAALEYCTRLKEVAERVSERLFVVPRLYIAKARTQGDSYQGLLLDGCDGGALSDNVFLCRKMFLEAIERTGLPIADELLFAEQTEFFGDLISHWFIGARQGDSPFFRGIASGLDVVVGIKNNLAGNLELLTNSIQTVGMQRRFFWGGKEVLTNGALCYPVLRGYSDKDNALHPNDDPQTITKLARLLQENGLKGFIMIDCNHANSGKNPQMQVLNAMRAVENPLCGGIMLESYLLEGRADNEYGRSKTDPCLGWEATEKLLGELFKAAKN